MAPQYGSVDIKGYGHGSKALYSCNHGYKLNGGEYITCNYGVWKGRIPVCKRKFTKLYRKQDSKLESYAFMSLVSKSRLL